MPGLFDVGKSALQSYRQALAVTGQNIANINTEGYKRRQATLEEVSASQGGITSISNQAGLGVRVEEIRRAFDSYILDRSRNASANFEASKSLLDKLSELENIILPQDSNLGIFINDFFSSLQEVATAPGDIAPRIVAIESGKAVAESFRQTAEVTTDLKIGVFKQSEQKVNSTNVLVKELAQINSQLMSSGQGGGAANSLLDTRDRVIDEISKLVEISTALDTRGSATLRLGSSGNGPILVANEKNSNLSVAQTFDGLQYSIQNQGTISPTSQILNGSLKGLSDAYTLIQKTLNELDEMAFSFASTLNLQHNEGIDLNNEKGKNLFSSSGFSVTQNPTNTSTISAEVAILDASKISPKTISCVYDAEAKVWRAYDETKTQLGAGKNSVILSGYEIKIAGSAKSGEEFHISPSTGFSKNLQFSLTKPDSLAAAATKIIFADTSNKSDADISASKIIKKSDITIPRINDVLSNSLSAISATEFYKSGAVGYIPKSATAVELVSLEKQPLVSFSLTSTQLANATSLSFTTATPTNKTYQFNIAYSNVFQGETGTWPSASDIAKYLNQGVLTTNADQDGLSVASSLSGSGNLNLTGALTSGGSGTFNDGRIVSITSAANDSSRKFTITGTDKNGSAQTEQIQGQNAGTALSTKFFKTISSISCDGASAGTISAGVTGLRLSDIGAFASGGSGNLTLALSSGTLASTTPQIISSGSAVTGAIENRSDASKIQIFTKEGRHIAGSALSDSEVNSLLTSENGFGSFAEYRAEHLNAYGGIGYRGTTLERTNTSADSVIAIGGDGSSARAFSAVSLLPDSPTESWDLTLGGNKIVNIPAGSSAGYAAATINAESSKYGIVAAATSRVELKNAGDSGTVSFQLGSKNTEFQRIEARVSATSMNTLAEKVNLYTNTTGVEAHISKDQSRLVLENKDGLDINVTDFSFDGNNGDTISAQVIDKFSKSRSKSIDLGGLQDELKFSLADSQLANASSISFAIGGTEHSFNISYQSAFGTAGEWTDVADIAKYLNRGTLKSGLTKLSDLGIYAEGSFGDLNLRLNQKAYTASSTGISTAATLASAGNLTINGSLSSGGSASFESARKISILSAGDDSTRSFTVTGTDSSGNAQSETIVGSNAGTAVTLNNFKTVTQISCNGATSGNVSVGLSSIAPTLSVTGASDVTGTVVGSKRITAAKFSGGLELTSSDAFSVSIDSQTVSSSTDARKNTLIIQTPNESGEKSTLHFTAMEGVDSNGADKNGLLANSTGSMYTVTLPNTGSGSTFSATVSAGQLETVTPKSVALEMTKKIRALSPVSAISGATAVASVGDISLAVSLSGAGNLTLGGPLASGGSATFSTPQRLAILSAGNDSARIFTITGTDLNGTSQIETVNGANVGTVLTSKSFKTVTQIASNGATAGTISVGLATLPNDGDSLVVKYDNQNYKLAVSYENPTTKFNPEISITGGEDGRLTAYFDKNNKLQISAPQGSLSGAQFSIPGNGLVSGNESAAKRFGLSDDTAVAKRTITGRLVSLPSSTKAITATLNGANIGITITPNGSGTSTLSTSNNGIIATFADTGTASTTNASAQIVLTSNENSGVLNIPSSPDAENCFGLKVSNYSISLNDSDLVVSSTNDAVVAVETSASSLADQRIKLSNLPDEDLIVLISGSGANRIAANFDIAPNPTQLSEDDLTVKVANDTGSVIEVLDAKTGHSIATRSLDSNLSAIAVGYNIQLTSKAQKNDTFQISENLDGTGDATNLDALIKLQKSKEDDAAVGNFQEIFAGIVSRVGASVQANELKNTSAEALRDSAAEFESQFSGVNLDEEAANLIEQQQAYQASARILSTARELFDTLLDSV